MLSQYLVCFYTFIFFSFNGYQSNFLDRACGTVAKHTVLKSFSKPIFSVIKVLNLTVLCNTNYALPIFLSPIKESFIVHLYNS